MHLDKRGCCETKSSPSVFESCHRKLRGSGQSDDVLKEFPETLANQSQTLLISASSPPNLSSSYYRMRVGDAKPGEIQGRSQESDSLGQFILVSINKHYLKHLSGPVKYLPCGSVTSPTQGIEYLIIVLTE